MAVVWVLGGGLIGAGWAAAFGLAGHAVQVIDPDRAAAQARLDEVWARATAARGDTGALRPVILAAAEGPAPALVQECLPERLDLKRAALAAILPLLDEKTLIASSSSGLSPDDLQQGLDGAGRLFIAHPCNPPWLMPVVELSGGAATLPEVLDRARAFYEGLGKRVLTLAKPMPGHLVNRLQAALWREAVHLVREGVASLADVEDAVTLGLAPRWCLMGPSAVFHVSGGPRGFEGFFDALAPEFERWWDTLGAPRFDAETRAALVRGMAQADPRSVAEIGAARDRRLPEILTFLEEQARADGL
ncbi:3-hydroxyacyl-CoA dehydrogenase family protein [Xinfangfangia pollutisoli]|uniref:3-hydroxyacyl-CoA dehydrogenase family protein n=1 Tax=Xinfangfangia pollutisoli TaxID=2865960 RepID=UPI001CD73DFE|nr:3-hydroxyacyl-CoA dehydrogenase NAD-binding domain-containing protein [Xinfangfangia pollutisoli]